MAEDIAAGTGDSQTRRELLKKLGVAAGALVWSTPIVQSIATPSASAQDEGKTGNTTTTRRSSTTTTRPTTTTTRRGGGGGGGGGSGSPTTTTTRRSTTTTTRPTTTTTRRGGGQGGGGGSGSPTTTTTRPTTTTTRSGGGGGGGGGSGSGSPGGSPEPGKDISHMDCIIRKGTGPWYGIQFDFSEGWGKHSSSGTTNKHCLASLSGWSQPPSSFSFSGFSNAIPMGNGRYKILIPVTHTIRGTQNGNYSTPEAFSKCGNDGCARAQHLGIDAASGKRAWLFVPCPT